VPNYLRYYVPGATVFITTVTHNRFPYLAAPDNAQLLLHTAHRVQSITPFRLDAYSIMPDHFHCLICPQGNSSFSKIMQSLKWNTTRAYKQMHSFGESLSLWQPRFWDHIIWDETDFRRHLDYIHYNPVKHGLVTRPGDWPFSSFENWRERGYYASGWGETDEPPGIAGMEPE
jgi:putative transposase